MSKRILVVNFYLEGRETAARAGTYPKSHLWGMDGLRAAGYEIRLLSRYRERPWLQKLNRWTREAFGNLDHDVEIRRQANGCDAVYVISGHYPFLRRARAQKRFRCPIFSWVYGPPEERPARRVEHVLPFLRKERGMDGYLCLTRAAESHFLEKHPEIFSRFVTWGADLEMFTPGTVKQPVAAMACGRSGRDFETLFRAAAEFPISLDLVAPQSVASGRNLPDQVRFVGGPRDSGSDQGLSYPELVRLQQEAFCHVISLGDSPRSAAGYTNLLEALAVGRPVVMTRTGCLDIDIEKEGVGVWVSPGDSKGMATAVRHLVNNPDLANAMGGRARALVERRFSLAHLNRAVTDYFVDAIGAP